MATLTLMITLGLATTVASGIQTRQAMDLDALVLRNDVYIHPRK